MRLKKLVNDYIDVKEWNNEESCATNCSFEEEVNGLSGNKKF